MPKERERARALEAAGGSGAEEARNIIARSLEREVEALGSVLLLAPQDGALETKITSLVDQLSGSWLLLTGKLTEQRKGNRIIFTIEAKEQPKPGSPKDASRPRSVTSDLKRIPARKVTGPMNVYYYDYVADRASADDLRIVERVTGGARGEIIAYEILNLVDGRRSIADISDYISAAYGPVAIEDVVDYLRVLEKIGVVSIASR